MNLFALMLVIPAMWPAMWPATWPATSPVQNAPLPPTRMPAQSHAADDPQAPLAEQGEALELTVDECVRRVLLRNLDLRIASLGNAALATGVGEALGAFDPEFYLSANGSETEQPTASAFQAPKNQSLNATSGLRGLYRSGLTYDLNYLMTYNRQSPSNPFFGLNPVFTSSLNVNLSQPLLRGFGSTYNESAVEQARLLVARGDLELYSRVQETAFSAIQAYWLLVEAKLRLETARAALEVAQELVSNNQKRLDAGAMTRLDVLTAQSEAARRKESLIRAQNMVGRSEDRVKALLAPGDRLADWKVTLVPTTEPALRDEPPIVEEDAVLAAFQSRSDLRALEVDLKAARLQLEVAENELLPRLDLNGSYGYAGLSGSDPASNDSKDNLNLWGNSLEPIRDRDGRSWSVGFDFSKPIGNRTAEAGERRARVEMDRAYITWMQLRMVIVQDLRGALRDVNDSKAATEAATQARILAEQQYQAEVVRLENQHSTTFQVREAQRDLFEARDNETASITAYEVLLAGLERARGTLAQQFGVDWEPATRPEGIILE